MTTTEAPQPSFWQRTISFAFKIWGVLRRPSSVFSLGFLVLGGETDETREVGLYEAVDDSLLRWRYCGPLVREQRDERRRFLECPNFVQIPPSEPGGEAKWILLTSPYDLVEYTTGSFDLSTLTFTPEQHGILDAGHDDMPNFYATNIVNDTEGNCVLLGWARGFAKGHGWNGALALPRPERPDVPGPGGGPPGPGPAHARPQPACPGPAGTGQRADDRHAGTLGGRPAESTGRRRPLTRTAA